MQIFKQISFAVLLCLLILPSEAFAKMISGKVASVDSATRKVTVSTINPVSGVAVNTDVWAHSNAVFSGVQSVADLHPGDDVWVEAEADSEGNLTASRITKS